MQNFKTIIIIPVAALIMGLAVGLGIGHMQVGKAQQIAQDKIKEANRKIASPGLAGEFCVIKELSACIPNNVVAPVAVVSFCVVSTGANGEIVIGTAGPAYPLTSTWIVAGPGPRLEGSRIFKKFGETYCG